MPQDAAARDAGTEMDPSPRRIADVVVLKFSS